MLITNYQKYLINQLPTLESLTPEQKKQEQINIINDWAKANPSRVLGDDFYQQRQYLTPETWKYVVSELNLSNDEILKNKKIPDSVKSNAFNNEIRKGTNEVAKPMGITMMTLATLPLASGAMTGANAFRAAHPFTATAIDAYFAGDGIIRNLFGDSGVKKTYKLAKEGDTWGAIKSGTGDALDLLGVSDVVKLGKKIANPLYRSAHAYNTIPQYGYEDARKRLKDWSSAILSGTDPNTSKEAQWVNDLRQIDDVSSRYLTALYEVDPKAANEIFIRGRNDASRLYNNLPLQYQYYIPNGDGTYRYNLEKIQKDWKELSGKSLFTIDPYDFYSEELATAGHHGIDVITGAGGNLTGNSTIVKKKLPKNDGLGGYEEFGIKLIEDVQDAHPFRRNTKQFSDILQTEFLDEITEKIRNKSNVIYNKLYNSTMQVSPKLNRFWYNYLGGRPLNKLRSDINLRLPGYVKEGFTKKPGSFWQKINKKMTDFEVGQLTGATPFTMRTYIPYTYRYVPKYYKSDRVIFPGKMFLGYHSKDNFIPPIYSELLQHLNNNDLKFVENSLPTTFNKNNLFIDKINKNK